MLCALRSRSQTGLNKPIRFCIVHAQGVDYIANTLTFKTIAERVAAAKDTAGDGTAQCIQTDRCSLIRQCLAKCLTLAVAHVLVLLHALLPLALVLGDNDVSHQVDQTGGSFFAAFRCHVLENIPSHAVCQGIRIQQSFQAVLLGQGFCQTGNGTQRECLIVTETPFFGVNDCVCSRAGTHNGTGCHRAASAKACGKQEIAHAHGQLIAERAGCAPLGVVLDLLCHSVAHGAANIGVSVIPGVGINLAVSQKICSLTNIGSAPHGSHHQADSGS